MCRATRRWRRTKTLGLGGAVAALPTPQCAPAVLRARAPGVILTLGEGFLMTFELHRPTLADLKKERALNEAEKKLIAGRKTGRMVVLGTTVPKKSLKKNTIRAELIRYLLLGGCKDARPHPKGVQVQGAWVSGALTRITRHSVHRAMDLICSSRWSPWDRKLPGRQAMSAAGGALSDFICAGRYKCWAG